MAKTLGIHLSGRRFQLVGLDGTFKKPKVRVCVAGRAPVEGEGESALELLTDELKAMAKEQRKQLESDNVGLAVESSMATFRHLSLPFAESSKIEEVLKFEIEGQLPQWDIDSVVVDFHTIESSPVESQLLVTAVPKDELGERIEAAAKAGLEPYDAEIEATALFRVAEQAELIGEESAQLLVHFGLRTTTLVTVIEGKLKAMRALHLDLEAFDGTDAGAESAGDEDGGREVAAEEVKAVTAADRAKTVRDRVMRELTRTMGSAETEVAFNTVLVCGIELEGLVGAEVQGVGIERLDPLEGLVELPTDERSRLVVAYGCALGRLGGSAVKPHLRREELTYASRFERLELPLGVLGLLTLTLLAALYIINGKVLNQRKADIESWIVASRNFMIGELGNPRNVGVLRPTAEEYESDNLFSYMTQIATVGDDKRTYAQQLSNAENLMAQKIRGLEEDLGAARDLTLPQSALSGANMVLDVIRELDAEESIGRFSIRSMTARHLPKSRSAPDRVEVDLDLTFFGANDAVATESWSVLYNTLSEQPWLIDEIARPATVPLETGEGIYLNTLKILVDTTELEVEN